MNCFITGSNGFLGSRLAEQLSSQGHKIKCLVRSKEKFSTLSGLPGTEAVIGDILNPESFKQAIKDCDTVFHMAAYTKPWSKDKSLPYKINVKGTENMLEISRNTGVSRFIFTSSAGVIGPALENEVVNENYKRTIPFFNEYESTKFQAEELVNSYFNKGMKVVRVNPSRIFGRGPINESNTVTRMIDLYTKGKWRLLPGDGSKTGNYVFVDDVVNGHILAAEKGKSGERYILGGENISFNSFFSILAEVSGKRYLLFPVPLFIMTATARFLEYQEKFTGISPPVTVPWVKKYMHDWSISSEKAVNELGYKITPFKQGVTQTLQWLYKKNLRP